MLQVRGSINPTICLQCTYTCHGSTITQLIRENPYRHSNTRDEILLVLVQHQSGITWPFRLIVQLWPVQFPWPLHFLHLFLLSILTNNTGCAWRPLETRVMNFDWREFGPWPINDRWFTKLALLDFRGYLIILVHTQFFFKFGNTGYLTKFY